MFEIGSVTTGDGIGTQPTDMTVHKLYVYNSCQDPLPVLGETTLSKAAGYKQFTLPHLQQLRCQVNASVWDFTNTETWSDWKHKILLTTDNAKVGKHTVCVRGPAEAGMVIPFGGDVVLTFPKAHSFYLGALLGVDMYLHGTGYQTLSSECVSPAWTMKTNATKRNCSYAWQDVTIPAVQATLQFPYLTLDNDVPSGELVELFRPPLPANGAAFDMMTLLGSCGYEKDSSSTPAVTVASKRTRASLEVDYS